MRVSHATASSLWRENGNENEHENAHLRIVFMQRCRTSNVSDPLRFACNPRLIRFTCQTRCEKLQYARLRSALSSAPGQTITSECDKARQWARSHALSEHPLRSSDKTRVEIKRASPCDVTPVGLCCAAPLRVALGHVNKRSAQSCNFFNPLRTIRLFKLSARSQVPSFFHELLRSAVLLASLLCSSLLLR